MNKKIMTMILILLFAQLSTFYVSGYDKATYNEISYQDGWPVIIEGVIANCQPTIDDLDGDGSLEIVIAATGSFCPYRGLYVLNCNGDLLENWPVDLGGTPGEYPSLGDINNDGNLEIISKYFNSAQNLHKMYAISFNGNVLSGWPVIEGEGKSIYYPIIEDINADGNADILTIGLQYYEPFVGYCYAYDYTGNYLSGNWPFTSNVSRPHTIPAVGDLDNDGDLEIVFGSSKDIGNDDTGGIYALDHEGNMIDNFPVDTNDNCTYTSPITLADLDQDGDLEIIGSKLWGNTTLCVFHHNGQKAFEIIDGNSGKAEIVPTDLDGDGDLEILSVTSLSFASGQINAYHHDGEIVDNWPVYFDGVFEYLKQDSVKVGDIDGDGESEILISVCNNDFSKNLIYAWNNDGTLVENYPIEFSDGPLYSYDGSTLSLVDLDNDQDIEIVFIGYQQSPSQGIYNTGIYVFDLDGQYNPYNMEWPQFRHDAQHTGCFKVASINNPPNKPTIIGSTSGNVGEEYEYTFFATDYEGDNICYYVDWGDNTNTGWTEYVVSGSEIALTHTWGEQGTYTISAKVKDVDCLESNWETLSVAMPVPQPNRQPRPSSPTSKTTSSR